MMHGHQRGFGEETIEEITSKTVCDAAAMYSQRVLMT